MDSQSGPIRRAAALIRDCEALLITAGAGMGIDSGLPDFRGSEGFWRAYPPLAERGLSFFEMANPEWFVHQPRLAWAFYGHRLHLYRVTVPHNGFAVALTLAAAKPGSYFVFTSNVDGQFQRARFRENRIEECHGSIHHLQCGIPCCRQIWEAEGYDPKIDAHRFEALDPLPGCPHCGSLARPNILMFADAAWVSDRCLQQASRFETWLRRLESRRLRPAVLELGAGTAVPTVRRVSEQVARRFGCSLIRVNPRDDAVPSDRDVSLAMGALPAIEAIAEQLACGV